MPDYKPESIKPIWRLPFEGPWPMGVAYLGGRRIAAGNEAGDILVWDLPETPVPTKIKHDNGKEEDSFEIPPPVRKLAGHSNAITRLRATPDGRLLVSASLDHTVRVWDLAASAEGETEVVLDSATREERARYADEARKKELLEAPGLKVAVQTSSQVLSGHNDWIRALGSSGDGKRLISGDDSGLVIVWDLEGRQEIKRWQCPGVAWVVSAALSADGDTAVVSQYRRKGGDFNNYPAAFRLYDVAGGEVKLDVLAAMYPDEKNPPFAYQYAYSQFIGHGLVGTAFSPDGKLIACGQRGEESEGKVHLLESETGKLVRSVPGHQYGICDLAFSADGRHLFTSGRDTQVHILRVEDGQEAARLGQPRGGQFTDWLSAFSLSPDELRLAAADISGCIQFWELA